MKISLILATLNREDLALRAINSVINQEFQDWEIIILDQTEPPCLKLKQLTDDERIIYKHLEKKGLSHARNQGLAIASGDVVGLMDDDAVYGMDALTKVNEVFETNHNVFSVYGKLLDPRYKDIYIKKNKDVKITWNNFMTICISPCSFIKKEFFNHYSFDENLGVGCYLGSAEESDVFAKLIEEKKLGIFNDAIVVFHYVPTPFEAMSPSNIDKHKSYCRGFGGFCAKHIIKFKSKEVRGVFYKAMLRTFCGLFLSVLKQDERKVAFYKETINSRKEGYKVYKGILNKEIDR